jgi:hypothetical protein
LVLFDNSLWLQDKAASDKGFNEKFGEALEAITSILRDSRITSGLSNKAIRTLSNRFLKELEDFLIPKRNLSQVQRYVQGKYETRQGRQPGFPRKMLPPARYIGIGYKDKGSARNLAYDGSPSWQEVCTKRLWQ